MHQEGGGDFIFSRDKFRPLIEEGMNHVYLFRE
jgi:hypothetical protein